MSKPFTQITDYEPKALIKHSFQRSFLVNSDTLDVWRWINNPRTFIDAQLPPYRVEFVPERFEVGVLNNHHGPGLNLPAVITVMEEPKYREMRYLYGSYVISPRIIRPTLIQFWLKPTDNGATQLRLVLQSWVHPWLSGPWTAFQKLFWCGFSLTINRGVARHAQRIETL